MQDVTMIVSIYNMMSKTIQRKYFEILVAVKHFLITVAYIMNGC